MIVTSQTEMNKVPQGYSGTVEVRSNPNIWITVPNGLYVRVYGSSRVIAYGSSQIKAFDSSWVEARNSSQVTAYDSSQVFACDSSRVEACDSSRVTACDSSQVFACDKSQVTARDSSRVIAYDFSQAVACDFSHVIAYDSARVFVRDYSQVRACGYSQVRACGYSQVSAYGSSQVKAYDFSQVKAFDFTRVRACGYSQVLRLSEHANLTALGNARIVELPKTVQDYIDYYGVEVRNGSVILYKAVDASLRSFYDGTTQYIVGETLTQECDPSRYVTCSIGLHAAYKDWAIRFGVEHSSDFRLLEVAIPLDKLVVPKYTDGKVRTSELTVLREVPREEF